MKSFLICVVEGWLIAMGLIWFCSNLLSCNPEKHSAATPTPVKVDTVTVVKDTTIYVPVFDYAMKDSMITEMNRLRDSLFITRYKIERVKYYMKICMHKPSQVKFLVGWIYRAVN